MTERTAKAAVGAAAWRRAASLLAPLAVAAALAGAAVVTVERSGCADPGRYVSTPSGDALVGGCTTVRDLPVWGTDDQAARRG